MPDYLAILYRNRWLIVTVFVVVIASTVAVTFLMNPVYESTAAVLIDTRQSSSALFQDPRYLGSTNLMQNELEILQSYSLREVVARELVKNPYIDSVNHVVMPLLVPPDDDTTGAVTASAKAIADRLFEVIAFEVMRESDVIKVTATSGDPREAAAIANTIVQAYYNRNVTASRSQSQLFREFLEKQVAEKQQALTETESTLRNYMEQHGVVSLSDEARNVIDQLSSLQAARDANEIEIESLLRSFADYQQQATEAEQLVGRILTQGTDPYIQGIQEEIARLEIQRDITLALNPQFASKDLYNQKLQEIETQIKDLRGKLEAKTVEYLANLLPAGENLSSREDPAGYLRQIKQKAIETRILLQSLQAKRKVLDESIKDYERKFAGIPSKSIQYARLERDRSSLEKLYLTLDEKFNEANIQEKSEFGYVDIFDPAVVPSEPTSPNLILNLALGIVLGSCFGVGLAFLREFMEARVYSPEDLKRKGYVVLSTVPEILPAKKDERDRAGHVSGNGRIDMKLAAFHDPLSVTAESYRHLRNSIRFGRHGASSKVIAVTSPEAGDGKTTTVANLAVSIAQSSMSVVVVDADLRQPSLHQMFGQKMKPGLSEILQGTASLDDVLIVTPQPNLHVLTCGGMIPNAAELLASPDMKFLIEQLKSRYSVVLFDSPPALAVTDATGFSTLVEGVVVVASAGKTSMDYLERTYETLQEVGATILGVVLNHFDLREAYGLLYRDSAFGYYGDAKKYGRKRVSSNGDVQTKRKNPATS